MGWVDVIADTLGAAGQSIGNHEQLVRQRKQMAIQEWEAQQRAEQLEFDQIRSGINPGAPVDPAILPKAIKYGLKSRIKLGADGQPVWADTLEDTVKRQDITRLSALTTEAEQKAQVALSENAARKSILENPEAFLKNPYEKQALMYKAAGFTGEPPRSMDELIRLKLADDQTMLEAARVRAGIQNAPRQMNPLQQEQLKKTRADNLLRSMGGMEVGGMVVFPGQDQKQMRALYQAELAKIMGGGSPQAPSSGGPAVGTRRIINGQPAVWDGTGWVAQ